jgi:hypothetical protein
MEVVCTRTFFHALELLARKPSIDDLSARRTMLEAEHESAQASLKESQLNEIKIKKGVGGQARIGHGGIGEKTQG